MPAKRTIARKPRLLKITVEHFLDKSPDTSTLGEYTDSPDEWAIVREGEHAGQFLANLADDATIPERGRNYRFFKPYAAGEAPGSADYQKYGIDDWKRMESLERGDWHHIGIAAKLEYTIGEHGVIQTLRSGGLWGIASDSDASYFADVAREELTTLRDEAEAIGIRWSKRMADAAMEVR